MHRCLPDFYCAPQGVSVEIIPWLGQSSLRRWIIVEMSKLTRTKSSSCLFEFRSEKVTELGIKMPQKLNLWRIVS